MQMAAFLRVSEVQNHVVQNSVSQRRSASITDHVTVALDYIIFDCTAVAQLVEQALKW